MEDTINVLPKGIRRTPQGTFEATIYNKTLEGGRVSRTFDDPDTANRWRVTRVQELLGGVKAPDVIRAPSVGVKLTAVLRHYLNADNARIAASDRPTVIWLQNHLTSDLQEVTTTWVDDWVRSFKVGEQKLAPGTIRKKVEGLARAIDWWYRREYPNGGAPSNPLRSLPIGYSSYDDRLGVEVRIDVERDRRLHPGEYELIEAVIQGKILPGKDRPWGKDDRADFLLLFRLIVATGLRLREAYSLRVRDFKHHQRTLHVAKSKTGAKRDIPTTRQVENWLQAHIEANKIAGSPDALIFPFWSGSTEGNVLRDTTIRMSKRFAKLFDYAGCGDMVEHDLRHEATCRWLEKKNPDGSWMFRPEEIRRITGHKSVQMFERYLSLRGSDLADRLD